MKDIAGNMEKAKLREAGTIRVSPEKFRELVNERGMSLRTVCTVARCPYTYERIRAMLADGKIYRSLLADIEKFIPNITDALLDGERLEDDVVVTPIILSTKRVADGVIIELFVKGDFR